MVRFWNMADRASASTRNVYYNFTSPRSSKLVRAFYLPLLLSGALLDAAA